MVSLLRQSGGRSLLWSFLQEVGGGYGLLDLRSTSLGRLNESLKNGLLDYEGRSRSSPFGQTSYLDVTELR